MKYYVLDDAGNLYGPADVATLEAWKIEGRIFPNTKLKNEETGHIGTASAVPGLFPAAAAAPPQANPSESTPPASAGTVYTPYQPQNTTGNEANQPRIMGGGAVLANNGPFWMVCFWCALSIGIFLVTHSGGLFIAAFTVFDAFKLNRRGHKLGGVAIAISVVTFLGILAGFLASTR